ncbi:MAG TPA: metallophosphoesterase family protein [Candidatus Limnocylindria bacterium]|nr:metallophosphoesterase family protein [Candidatus Limnocylindria bacterium]
MRIALLADVHANEPALRAVLTDAARIGCDAIWCAGDVVGRGPHPNQVVDLLRALEIPSVQGNWDEAVGMGREVSGSIWESPQAEKQGGLSLEWSREALTEENLAWLRQLPATLRFEADGRTARLFHGTPLKQNEYLWENRPSRYFARIASDEGDDLFCFGHTHETYHRVSGQAHFVAAGSVGCGEPGVQSARYAVIYVTEADVVVGFRGIEYDRQSVLDDMAAAGLPAELLTHPPVPHPLVDPGALPAHGMGGPARSDAPASA